jgi:hypothetical protein
MFPGARITIRHADCDLTGVMIETPWTGAMVPEPGGGVGSSGGLEIDVAPGRGDVAVVSEYRPGATQPNA